MRTPTPTTRRLNARARAHAHPPIEEVARLIDEGLGLETGHAAVHVSFDASGDIVLGVRSIPLELHPFALLAGTVAPSSWSMFGVHVRGTAHHLDDGVSQRCSSTYLVGRDGAEAAIVREGNTAVAVPGPAEGTLPDLCRRVLQLATPPPPSSTAVVFALAWLDEILEALALRPGVDRSADDVIARHAARVQDPADFVAAVRRHADEWPWQRLRAEPWAVALPGSELPASVTEWMDDGAYARWALGAFPPLAVLAADVSELVGGPAGIFVREAVERILADEVLP